MRRSQDIQGRDARTGLARSLGHSVTCTPEVHDGSAVVRRYLKDLPSGLSKFNDDCLAKQREMPELAQNVEEVRKIVHDAMVLPSNSAFANGNALIDSYNEEPEDGMEEDGSLEFSPSY